MGVLRLLRWEFREGMVVLLPSRFTCERFCRGSPKG